MRIKKLSTPGRVLIAVLALLTPVALGAAASSANAIPSPVTWTVLVGNQAGGSAIQGERFLPGDITIDAGDSVTWKANSTEPHTVTFFGGGVPQDTLTEFNPVDPQQNAVQGPDAMDGASYFNSGVLTTLPSINALPPTATIATSYTLSFPDAGNFTYYCLVHGKMMRGVVHVQEAGAPYPASQDDVDADAAWLAGAIVTDGRALRAQAKAAATNHRVITGADDGVAMVMRFVNGKVVVHKGQKVTFVNNMSMGAPHTVTFGIPHAGPGILDAYGSPANYKGGDLSSSIIPPHGRFTVTFNKVGTYSYICLLHSQLGMVGKVVVTK